MCGMEMVLINAVIGLSGVRIDLISTANICHYRFLLSSLYISVRVENSDINVIVEENEWSGNAFVVSSKV